MNKITFTIAFLLTSLASFSQNWAPFALGEAHHYRSDTGTWIDRTIRVDSVTGDASDSIWHFPRLLIALDRYNALTNQPHFCQRTMRLQGGGHYQFTDPGNVSLDALSMLGGIAVVDSATGATGIVTRLYAGFVLGVADSLKVVTLTAGDSLVLSKAHGLVEWPASLGPQRYLLTGLQAQQLGDTLPGFDGFYRYKWGDVFCWKAGGYRRDNTLPQSQQPAPWFSQFKLQVLSALRDSAGLHLVVKSILEQDEFETRDTSEVHIPDYGRGLPAVGPGEMVRCGAWLQPYFFPTQYSDWDAVSVDFLSVERHLQAAAQYFHRNDTTVLTFASMEGYQFWYDPLAGPAADSLEDYYLATEKFEIAEGLGFAGLKSWAIDYTSSHNWQIKLAGYVIDGDTVGEVWPDEAPAAAVPVQSYWPNPASTVLYVAPETKPAASKVELVDMLGRLVRSQTVDNGIATFDVSDLRPGIYLIRPEHGTKAAYEKVIILH